MGEKKKTTIVVDEKILEKVKEYCSLNGVTLADFMQEALNEHLLLKKYGDTPFADYSVKEPTVEDKGENPPPAPHIEINKEIKNIEPKKPKKIILK